MTTYGLTARRGERGIALMIALFAILLITAIALGMMFMADADTDVNKNYRNSQVAYFGSKAGLEAVRGLMVTPIPATYVPTTLPSNAANTGIIYVTNSNGPADVIAPNNIGSVTADDELCREGWIGLGMAAPAPGMPCTVAPNAAWYKTTPVPAANAPGTGTTAALPFKWVRITLKENTGFWPQVDPAGAVNQQICWNGTNEVVLPAGNLTCEAVVSPKMTTVFMLTSLGLTPTANGNGARRIQQIEVAQNPPFITNAALDTNDFVNTSGSSLTINGYDNCKCSCPIAKGKSAPTCTDRTTGAACTGNTYAIFTSKTISSSGSPALVAGTTPPNAQNQVYPYDVPSLIQRYSSQPGAVNITGPPYNVTCTPSGTPGVPANCGTFNGSNFGSAPSPFPPTDPNNPVGLVNQITYVPGSVDLQAHCNGGGVLIVDGDLTVHGGIDFYGLIIVRGVLTFAGGGSGQGNNIIGGVVAGSGSVADALGGSINMQFDSCALNRQQVAQPPTLLSTREEMY